jgi:hypothetical protein
MSAAMVPITVLAALLVLGVLIAGLWNMVRQGASPSTSQTLMRWRVGLQFVAVAIAMAAIWLIKG